MISTHQFKIGRNIASVSINPKVVDDDIKNSFMGLQYAGLGLIQNYNVIKIGNFIPTIGKKSVSQVPVTVNFDIFSIPSGFIISNAIVSWVRRESNNMTFVFSCEFYDIAGKLIPASEPIKNKKTTSIIGTMVTMGKSAESLQKYNFLKEGDRVNIVCIMPSSAESKPYMMFNCDLIEQVEPKYFKYESFDTSEFSNLFIKDKVNYPLFSKHNMTKYVTELVEGTVYAMTIYGFAVVNSASNSVGSTELTESVESIDFIKQTLTSEQLTSNGEYETALGFNTLGKYLYYSLYNWRCAIEGLNKN